MSNRHYSQPKPTRVFFRQPSVNERKPSLNNCRVKR